MDRLFDFITITYLVLFDEKTEIMKECLAALYTKTRIHTISILSLFVMDKNK